MTGARNAMHVFAAPAALAEALAGAVAARLADAVGSRGAGLLAVSGGRTPTRFFETLSRHDIDWNRVTVTLVDERFVPPSSDRSNERLVRQHLLQSKAAAARFVGLYRKAATAEAAAEEASAAIGNLPLPLDVVVLGMGGDGHTASFFPDAGDLDRLMSMDEERAVLPVHAQSAGELRLTLSLPVLAAARFAALHIEGEAKRDTFETAMSSTGEPPAPIRIVIERTSSPVHVFWAPQEEESS